VRKRQWLYLVGDVGHASDTLEGDHSLRHQACLVGVAFERDSAVIDGEREEIEDAVAGQLFERARDRVGNVMIGRMRIQRSGGAGKHGRRQCACDPGESMWH